MHLIIVAMNHLILKNSFPRTFHLKALPIGKILHPCQSRYGLKCRAGRIKPLRRTVHQWTVRILLQCIPLRLHGIRVKVGIRLQGKNPPRRRLHHNNRALSAPQKIACRCLNIHIHGQSNAVALQLRFPAPHCSRAEIIHYAASSAQSFLLPQRRFSRHCCSL